MDTRTQTRPAHTRAGRAHRDTEPPRQTARGQTRGHQRRAPVLLASRPKFRGNEPTGRSTARPSPRPPLQRPWPLVPGALVPILPRAPVPSPPPAPLAPFPDPPARGAPGRTHPPQPDPVQALLQRWRGRNLGCAGAEAADGVGVGGRGGWAASPLLLQGQGSLRLAGGRVLGGERRSRSDAVPAARGLGVVLAVRSASVGCAVQPQPMGLEVTSTSH